MITETTLIQRVLSGKVFQALGKSSYAFYLIHVGLFAQLPAKTQSLPLIYLMLTGASLLLWKFVEVPLNNVIRNRLSGRRERAAAIPENGA